MKAEGTRTAKRFKTNTPTLSEPTIARIRAAARRFVRSGGSIFPASLTDVDEHIGNVVMELQGTAAGAFEQALETTTFANPDDHGRISNASNLVVSEQSDAAFLFGAFVGLELAALTFGQAGNIATHDNRPARRKRGAR